MKIYNFKSAFIMMSFLCAGLTATNSMYSMKPMAYEDHQQNKNDSTNQDSFLYKLLQHLQPYPLKNLANAWPVNQRGSFAGFNDSALHNSHYDLEFVDNTNYNWPDKPVGIAIYPLITPASRPIRALFSLFGGGIFYLAAHGALCTTPLDLSTRNNIAYTSGAIGASIGYQLGSICGQRIEPVYVNLEPDLTTE